MEIERAPFGEEFEGRTAELISAVVDPDTHFRVDITDFGADLVHVQVPDRNGEIADISFGHNSPEDYSKIGGHLGGMVGRVISRIVKGTFTLDGENYELTLNNNDIHHKHGGFVSFDKKWWDCVKAEADGDQAVIVLTRTSPDGEENYPGELNVTVTYTITPQELGWEITATTDKPTIVNIASHAYWNLDGLEGVIDDLELKLNASKVMTVDEESSPTGEINPVEDTHFDFRETKTFGRIFEEAGDIDHTFLLDGYEDKTDPKELFQAAELVSPNSGRKMTVWTTEPAMIVYSGNSMGKLTSFGVPCKNHGAICLECVRVPNAINFPEFADQMILRPGDSWYQKTVHRFSLS